MSVNLNDLKSLNDELASAITNMAGYHEQQRQYVKYYRNSVFYQLMPGEKPPKQTLKNNLLYMFANKNIEYISQFPDIKIPTTGADPILREAASAREKILLATHQASGSDVAWSEFAFDGTVRSVAVNETYPIFDGMGIFTRMATRRYQPQHCYWQLSNDGERRVIAFWAVWSITADECQERYGRVPTADLISPEVLTRAKMHNMDGHRWFTQAIRWDGQTRTAWAGNLQIEKPHQHGMGEIPIDLCEPFFVGQDDDVDGVSQGAFFLEPMLTLQAELNETKKRRKAVNRRMSSPMLWANGVTEQTQVKLEEQMEKDGGGIVGLPPNGSMGILQLQDVKLLREHEQDIVQDMLRLSGFSGANLGELVGANTSGDAIGMYLVPTLNMLNRQWIHWAAFLRSINAKILRGYDTFMTSQQRIKLSGFGPASTIMSVNSGGQAQYRSESGSFEIEFGKDVINGSYGSIVLAPAFTPKEEEKDRRFWMEASTGENPFVSRTTAYEKIGILSPQDELALVKEQLSDPLLNPKVTEMVNAMNPQPAAAPPAKSKTVA